MEDPSLNNWLSHQCLSGLENLGAKHICTSQQMELLTVLSMGIYPNRICKITQFGSVNWRTLTVLVPKVFIMKPPLLTPLSTQQNGNTKHQNCTIFDHVHTILIDTLFLWAEAANYIIYTKNYNSTHALTNTTPYKVQHNKKPDISRLCPFGCKAYVYDHSPK